MGNPLVALQVRNPVIKSPFGRMASLQSLRQGNQLNQQAIDAESQRVEAQKSSQQQQELVDALYTKHSGDMEKVIPAFIQAGGSSQLAESMKAAEAKKREAHAKLTKDERDRYINKAKILAQVGQAIMEQPPEQRQAAYTESYRQLVQGGMITPDEIPMEYPGDRRVNVSIASSIDAVKQLEMAAKKEADRETSGYRSDTLSAKTVVFKNHRWQFNEETKKYDIDLGPVSSKTGGPSASGKALAERTKQKAVKNATKAHRKRMDSLRSDWQKDGDTWFNFKTSGQMTDAEMEELKVQYQNDLSDDIEDAEDAYDSQLVALGFDVEAPAGRGGMVKLRAPNGDEMEIPEDQVQHYVSKGAVIVR